jgi:hypothetical protein
VIAAVLQLHILSSVLTLTCMNDLSGGIVLKGERILFNVLKDIYFTSKMKFEKLITQSSVQKELINFFIFWVLYVS